MILIPGRLAYVLIPRTGTRTTLEGFMGIPGAQNVGRHHGYVACDEPVYATIRDPYTLVLSHYWRVKDKISFEQYVKQRVPRLTGRPLQDVVIDRYFIYEDGLANIFEQLGYPDVQLGHIGATHSDKAFLTSERIDLINRTFPEDVALYQKVTHGRRKNFDRAAA